MKEIDNLTASNYVVPKGEEGVYHAVIEVKQFDPKTGRRISTPRIQKFGKKSFETSVRDCLMKQGYEIRILHDPNNYLRQQAEAARRSAAERKAAEQKKFDEAVQRAVDAKLDAAVSAAVEEALAKVNAEQKPEPPVGQKPDGGSAAEPKAEQKEEKAPKPKAEK